MALALPELEESLDETLTALVQNLHLSVWRRPHAGDKVLGHLGGRLLLLLISFLSFPDVDLATEPIGQHKAVIGYQQLMAKALESAAWVKFICPVASETYRAAAWALVWSGVRPGAQALGHLGRHLPISDALRLGLALLLTGLDGQGQAASLVALQDVGFSASQAKMSQPRSRMKLPPALNLSQLSGADMLLSLHLVEFPGGSWGGLCGDLVKC